METNKPTKYFVYVRKSSEDDTRQIQSIPDQKKELKKVEARINARVIDTFEESQSAKQPGRPKFNTMIERIKKGDADGIIVWKLDRLSRNPIDSGTISWLLQQGIIKAITTPERQYLPDDNVIMMSVEQSMANQYIRDLRTNSMRGTRTKNEKGLPPFNAPIGYLNDKTKVRGERDIYCDPDRFHIVQELQQIFLSCGYTPYQLWKIAIGKRLTIHPTHRNPSPEAISLNTLYNILKNPFYYGWYTYQGELTKGSYQPSLTEEEYWKIQRMLGRNGVQRPQVREFSYTGMIKCGECGCSIVADYREKTRKNGEVNILHIYHCTKKKADTKCAQPSIEVKELNRQISEYLSALKLPESIVKWAIEQLREAHSLESTSHMAELKNKQKAYSDIQNQLNNLTALRLKEIIDDNEFIETRKELKETLAKLKDELSTTEESSEAWLELAENAFNFCRNAQYWFDNGSIQEKRIVLNAVGSNLTLHNKKLTIESDEFFVAVVNGVKSSIWLPGLDSNQRHSR